MALAILALHYCRDVCTVRSDPRTRSATDENVILNASHHTTDDHGHFLGSSPESKFHLAKFVSCPIDFLCFSHEPFRTNYRPVVPWVEPSIELPHILVWGEDHGKRISSESKRYDDTTRTDEHANALRGFQGRCQRSNAS